MPSAGFAYASWGIRVQEAAQPAEWRSRSHIPGELAIFRPYQE
ncbi:hypothetical protein [Microcoleus sp. FACHB-831]|nr:hypothetical protein [Microcoleus sp. FACHB-831]